MPAEIKTVEVVTTIKQDKVVLTLSKEQAEIIFLLVGNVYGDQQNSYRYYTDQIYDDLKPLVVQGKLHNLSKGWLYSRHGTIDIGFLEPGYDYPVVHTKE